jgi:hypothetical protein
MPSRPSAFILLKALEKLSHFAMSQAPGERHPGRTVHRMARHLRVSLRSCGRPLLLLLLMCALWPQGLFANSRLPAPKAIWAIDHQGTVRFCYDRNTSVIYFVYDQAAAKTSIIRKGRDGQVESVGEFPGSPDERSLSCSDDGDTIAAMDGQLRILYLSRGGRHALYQLSHSWTYGLPGVHPLLAPDGKSIVLPEIPQHESGDDLLAEMRVFLIGDARSVFFVGADVFSEEGEAIVRYSYFDHDWRVTASIPKPANFDVSEISACGSHVVASLSDDETAKFLLLNETAPIQNDWLGKIGIRKLFKQHRSTLTIIGSFGRCAFPLYPIDRAPWLGRGIVSFDDSGAQEFSFGAPIVAITNSEILLSRDGCFALVHLFRTLPSVPQFTMPQQVHLLSLPDRRGRL